LALQWHPERMPDDAFARKIFGDFVAAVGAESSGRLLLESSDREEADREIGVPGFF